MSEIKRPSAEREMLEEIRKDHDGALVLYPKLWGAPRIMQHRAFLLGRIDALTQERDTAKGRFDWLLHELNELYSNPTRDIFGLGSDEEGEITVEWIDEQRSLK